MLFYFLRKIAHGLLCDDAAVPVGKRVFRFINCGKDLGPATFTLLPKGKGFLDGILLAPQPSALYGLTNKCFLISCELYFHWLSV